MNYWSIDALIVYGFLLVTLLVGLWAGRGVKDIREYALANRVYGTGVLTMTILATYITGSQGLGYVGYVFDDGILPVVSILICGTIICFLFIARYIAPNIVYFDGCLTMAELMGQLYGQSARIWVGILGSFYSVVIATLQIIWLGYIGELLDIPSQWSILLGGGFLVLYSARGGMKAVAITDVLQFVAIVVFVPLVANVVLDKVGGIKKLFNLVPASTFDILHHPSLKDYIIYCIWGLFPAFPLSFPFIQRMLMAKYTKQVVNSQYLSITYLTVFYFLLTLIGLSAIALKAMEDVNMPSQGSKVFVYLTKHYLSPGIRGIIGIGFIGGVMSTADSFLHSAGLLLVHDVIKPMRERNQSTINELKISQYITFIFGILAVALALTHQVLPRIQYGGVDLGKGLNIVIDFIAITFTIPLIAGIMGLKTDARSFFSSLTFTFTCFIILKLYFSNYFLIPFTILANAISFFGAHIIQNNGLAITQLSKPIIEINTLWRPRKKAAYEVLLIPINILKSSIKKVARYRNSPTLFALFICFHSMLSMLFYTSPSSPYYGWLLAIEIVGALLCVGLLLKSHWPSWLHAYFPIYWYLALIYCLPFSATVVFVLSGNSIEGVVGIGLATMLLLILVDKVSFFILAGLGSALGYALYKQAFGNKVFHLDGDTKYWLLYQTAFVVIIGMLFLPKRQQLIKESNEEKNFCAGKFLGEQMAFVLQATKRLASHIDFYVRNTQHIYEQSSTDGFYTLVVHGMQTIEDPILYKLLKQVSPTLLKLRKRSQEAMNLLKSSVKSETMADNLYLASIKACVTDSVVEFKVHYPTYECIIYQLVYTEPIKPILKVVSLRLCQDYLLIRDYSELFPREEFLPLIRGIASLEGQNNVRLNKNELELINRRIKSVSSGYQEFKLPFPPMKIAA